MDALAQTGLRLELLATTAPRNRSPGGWGTTIASSREGSKTKNQKKTKKKQGGFMVEINSEAEQQLVTGMYGSENYHWIGLNPN